MNVLEQYFKPPTNNNKELINDEGQQDQEENIYPQNQENGNENRENIERYMKFYLKEDSYNSKNDKNFQNKEILEDDNDIVQGINNIGKRDINSNKEEYQFDIEENKLKKNEYDYLNNNFLNLNENNKVENPQYDLMKELLYNIRKIKEKRNKNNICNYNTCKANNIDNLQNMDFDNTKMEGRNENYGTLNINKQICKNNPKMKELVNILKDYSKEKNEKDEIQINFYNTKNQINIVKPEVFFNNNNKKNKNKNINFYNKNTGNKYYISVIDGRAIINGKRINMNSRFLGEEHNFKKNKLSFNEFNYKNNLFEFNDEKLKDKENKFNNNNTNNNFNLDFKFNDLNFSNNRGNYFKKNNKNESKIELKQMNKNNFFNKDYYNEELDKIDNDLFNMNNTLNKLKLKK